MNASETIIYKDKILTLLQNPYIDMAINNPWQNLIYRATAIDDHDNDYEIIWDVVNLDCEDESESCDWTNFKVRSL